MFKVELGQVTGEQRYAAKRMNFGIVYGITPHGLYEGFLEEGADGWTLEACEELINMYDTAFPEVGDYRKEQIDFGTRHGYVKDMFGRRRFTPGLTCPIGSIRSDAQRSAGNMPIQSSAQGIIKQAGNMIYHLREKGKAPCDFSFLLQIHDEIFTECDERDMPSLVNWMVPIMEKVVNLSVPVVVDAKAGKRWGKMKELDLSNLESFDVGVTC